MLTHILPKQAQDPQLKPFHPWTWEQLAMEFSTPGRDRAPDVCPVCGSTDVNRYREQRICARCLHEWEVWE